MKKLQKEAPGATSHFSIPLSSFLIEWRAANHSGVFWSSSMNLAHTLLEQTRLRPNAPAIIDTLRGRSRITTFAELDLAAARVARLLVNHGLKPGDAVLVFHPMSAELYVALLALFRLRLVAMFLDPSAGREHIERCCVMNPPKALIAGTKAHLLRLVVPALRR